MLSDDIDKFIEEYPETLETYRWNRWRTEVAALEAQLAALREALTDDGKLTPHHFRTWSGALEEEQRYESRLTQWLKIVADALESLDA